MRTLHVSPRTALICLLVLAASSSPTAAAPQEFPSETGTLHVSAVAGGLTHPWSLAFLPDGRMLVTERPGQLRIVERDGRVSDPIAGVPDVHAEGQGGLLDVALDPAYASNRFIYLSYAEPREDGAATAVARARLGDRRLQEVKVIFRQQPAVAGSDNHFGSRLAFAPDGSLFVTLGDRYSKRESAQAVSDHIGTIVRIAADGEVPDDNPYAGRSDALPEIWSWGHRNVQGAAIHPDTGALWAHEHGAQGGDEINVPQPGRNYGWPVITHGVDYDGSKIGVGAEKAGMEQPVHQWTPSIAPSGMAFYTGDAFPDWRGNLLVGSLKFSVLVRLELDGTRVVREERLLEGLGERIRDVRQGPDGLVYLVTDSARGQILRIGPE